MERSQTDYRTVDPVVVAEACMTLRTERGITHEFGATAYPALPTVEATERLAAFLLLTSTRSVIPWS